MAVTHLVVHVVVVVALVALSLGLQLPASAHGQATRPEAGLPPASMLGQAPNVPLPGHVPGALARATPLPPSLADAASVGDRSQPITFSVVLRRTDEAGLQAFLRAVHDPRSPSYRRFAGAGELARRFGPSQQAYDALLGYLLQNGFTLVSGSTNRLLITARGTREQVNRVFGAQVRDYVLNGEVRYANSADPLVPATLAPSILAIIGLSSLAQGRPASAAAARPAEQPLEALPASVGAQATATPAPTPLTSMQVATAYGAQGVLLPSGTPATGAGQTIGLTEFSAFNRHNIVNWLISAYGPCSGQSAQSACVQSFTSRLTITSVGGSASATATPLPTPHPSNTVQGEAILDIAAVMGVAQGANYAVYEHANTNFTNALLVMLNQMIERPVNVISSSWSTCESLVSTSDVSSYTSVVSQAATQGIPVFFAAGDQGTTCVDNGEFPNSIGFPQSVPYVIVVGGTILTVGANGQYYSERWWSSGDASGPVCVAAFNQNATTPTPIPNNLGCGAYGQSTLVPAPTWLLPYLPTPTPTMRTVPDVSAYAFPGIWSFIGEPQWWYGTSLATPIWAASMALIQQAIGTPGPLPSTLYSLGNTSAFHPPSSMLPAPGVAGPTNDFAHLGLGSPNLPHLAALLGGSPTPTTHPLTATVAALTASPTPQATLHPATQTAIIATVTAQALTPSVTAQPATQTVLALTGTPTHQPLTATAVAQTATIQALTATATPTVHPLTATAIAQTATVQALTATATPTLHPLTQTAIALTPTATSTPVRAPTTALNAPITSGTPGVAAATQVGQVIQYGGQVSGTWRKTGSGAFVFTASNSNAAIVPGSIPALTLPTTAGNESGTPLAGHPTVCTPVGQSSPFTTTCQGTTIGDVLLGAQVTVTFALVGGGTTTSTGQQVAGTAASSLTPAQAQTQAQGTAGFAVGTAGLPCAGQVGQQCQVSGAVTGSLTRTGSMSFTLAAPVPAGVPAGITPVAVFSTDAGVQAVACGAPAGAAGTAYSCTGAITGNALQGSTAALCLTAGTACLLGTVTGPGTGTVVVPLLPPLPPAAPPLPPAPVFLPPPPAALMPPLGPVGGPARPEVPVIPEADTLLLLAIGLAGVGLLARRGRGRRE